MYEIDISVVRKIVYALSKRVKRRGNVIPIPLHGMVVCGSKDAIA